MNLQNPYVRLHISIILSCFTSIFGRIITLNEGLLVFYRLLMSLIILLPVLELVKKAPKTDFKSFLKIAGVGMLLGIHWLFFYGSIKYANVSIGIVCFSLVSFFTALIEKKKKKHRIFKHEILFSLITIIGISLIFHFDSQYRIGIILGVISSAVAALYTITNRIIAKHYESSSTILFHEFLGGLIIVSLIMPFYLHIFPVATIVPTAHDMFYLFLLVTLSTIGLYALQIQSLKYIPPFTVNLSYNLEPVYTVILAIIIFQENKDLSPAFYIGMALIIISVILQSVYISKFKKV